MPPRLVLALLGGVALAGAFEPLGLAVLLPVGVAALPLALRGATLRQSWLIGLAHGIGFCFPLLVWMRVVGPDAWLALASAQAAFFAPLGLAVAVLLRLRWWPLWVALAWVAVETWRGSWPFGGLSWGRLSYATAGTPWGEALPWLGMTGVSLLVALTGTVLAWLVAGGVRRWRSAAVAGTALAVATAVPALATLTPHVVDERTIAVVQGDVPGAGDDLLAVHREVTRNHVEATLGLARDVAAGEEPRPDLVLWPENATAVDPFTDVEAREGIARAASAVGVPLLVGAMVDSPRTAEVLNQGIVWRPGVGGGDRYTKRHPVPFGEYIPWRDRVFTSNFGKLELIPRDMASGTRTTPLRIAGARVADAICFDVAYDDAIHDQLAAGGQLLVVQTSNAMFIDTGQIDQQFEITRLRALETGRFVAVAATNGVSGVIAPDGEVLAAAEPRTTAVLVEEVGLVSGLTPAVWMGAWPGRAAVALTIGAVVAGLVPYRRRRAARPGAATSPNRPTSRRWHL